MTQHAVIINLKPREGIIGPKRKVDNDHHHSIMWPIQQSFTEKGAVNAR